MEKIIIFGASKQGIEIKRNLEDIYQISYFCDNNIKKQGHELDGIKILSFDQMMDIYTDEFIDRVIISLKDPDSIIEQIRERKRDIKVYCLSRKYFLNKEKLLYNFNNYLVKIDIYKPRLEYFEYHVTHHCNLKCKGCGHFSNIAKPEFANLEQYKMDIKRLKELYWGVKIIRLMGGEPLLNPRLTEFIEVTRQTFPDADIRVVTNGLLIPKVNKSLFKVMTENAVCFNITNYPPTDKIREIIELICIENNIHFSMSKEVINKFFDNWNVNKKISMEESFENCISKKCHFLQDGKISVCGLPILYNKFKTQLRREYVIVDKDIIDIYDEKLDGFILNDFLTHPISACVNCDNVNLKWFNWEGSYPYLD